MPAKPRAARHRVPAAAYDQVVLSQPVGYRPEVYAPEELCQPVNICRPHAAEIRPEERHALSLFRRVKNVYQPAEAVKNDIQQTYDKPVHKSVVMEIHLQRAELRNADALRHPLVKRGCPRREKSAQGLPHQNNVVQVEILRDRHNRLLPLDDKRSTVQTDALPLPGTLEQINVKAVLPEILALAEKLLIAGVGPAVHDNNALRSLRVEFQRGHAVTLIRHADNLDKRTFPAEKIRIVLEE